jgi:hypothetical protein
MRHAGSLLDLLSVVMTSMTSVQMVLARQLMSFTRIGSALELLFIGAPSGPNVLPLSCVTDLTPDRPREALVPLGGGGCVVLDPRTDWIWITTLVFRLDTFLRSLRSQGSATTLALN